jgi:hypothetical protein
MYSNKPAHTISLQKNDGAWVELRKWYEDIHQKEIKVTEGQAKIAAKNYMENERRQNLKGLKHLTS